APGGSRRDAPGAADRKCRRTSRYACRARAGEGESRTRLTGAEDTILEGGELLDAHRAARVHAAGGDADLGAEAELAAVGELGRGVVQHDRRIDLRHELVRRRLVGGDDRVGVVRAVALHVGDRLVDAVDDFHRDDGVEEFGAPVLLARRLDARVDALRVAI